MLDCKDKEHLRVDTIQMIRTRDTDSKAVITVFESSQN